MPAYRKHYPLFIAGLAIGLAVSSTIAGPATLETFQTQIKKDTANRPLVDEFDGTRNWTYRDIVKMNRDGSALQVLTEWFPKAENREPAKRMCKYLSAYGSVYGFERVTIKGKQDSTLASCEKWP